MPAHQHKPERRRLRRLARLGVVITAMFVAAGVAAIVYVRIALHGERLAHTVSEAINAQIRGRVEAASITWPLSAIPRALLGGHVPVEVRHVRIYDELGELIVEAELVKGEIAPFPAAFPRHDVIVRAIELRGGYVLLRDIPRELPAYEADDRELSLIAAFEPPPQRGMFVGKSGVEHPLVDLRDFEVHDVTLELALPDIDGGLDDGAWPDDTIEAASEAGIYAIAEGISGTGFFVADGVDPLRRASFFSIEATAERGSLRIDGVQVDVEDLEVERFAQLPHSWSDSVPRDLEIRASGRTPEGARFRGRGGVRDLYEAFRGRLDFVGEVEEAGGFASAFTGGAIAGDDLSATVQVSGPTLSPLLSARVAGATFELDVGDDQPPLPVAIPDAAVELEMVTGAGRLSQGEVRAAGGAVTASGSFLIDEAIEFEGHGEITEPLELRPYLPPEAVFALDGSQLSGQTHVAGRVSAEGVVEEIRATDIDLTLGRAHIAGKHRYTSDGRLHTEGLEVRVGRTMVVSPGGAVDLVRDLFDDIRLSIRSRDFDDWLRRYDAPPVARTLRGTSRIHGPSETPRLSARLVAGDVPLLGDVSFNFVHRGERAGLHAVHASALGGELAADGDFRLGDYPRILGFEASASGIDLSRVPLVGSLLAGTARAELRASGPFAGPAIELDASAEDFAIAGETFHEAELTAAARGDGARTVALHLARTSGGALDIDAALRGDDALSGSVALDDLDLSSLAVLGGDEPVAGGMLDAWLELSGTTDTPSLAGRVTVKGAWLHDMHLGTAELRVEPEAPGIARVRGRLFEGLAEITGTVETVAPYRADLTIRAHRAELDRLVPELAAQADARAWVSGEARIRGPLLAENGEPPDVDVRLDEAVVHIDQSDLRGRPRPVRIENQAPIHIGFGERGARIRGDAVLAGPAGSFIVSGGGRPEALDLRIRGDLPVDLLAPYLQQQFDAVSGAARLDIRLTGATDAPRISGTVDVNDIEARLAGQDAILRAPSGKIEFENDQLAVTGLAIQVVDPYSDEVAELTVAGGVRLEEFQPVLWALHVNGSLGGKLLLALFPEKLSSARGSAELSVSLLGPGLAPDIDGELRFATERPIAVTPRGMSREILLDRGAVRFTGDLVEIERVGGWVDDEGYIADVSGEIGLVEGRPADIDVTITADDLPFRIPRTLELMLGLREVRIVGDFDRGIEVAGDVLIIDGRYIQDFNPLLDEIRPRRVVEETPAFYDEIPILANADLSLNVETRTFFVRNNVANVELSGGLEVTGTPVEPQLDGVVRVEGGSFKFQGVRAEFQRTTGTVAFERFRTFPESTPTLDIRSESEYRDYSGEDHLVVLTLTGPLGQLQWDLFTTAGLNKAQTFLLIVSGRTPEEARRVIGDEPVGRGPGEFAGTRSTQAPDGNLALVDQLVKDLAGDFFSLLIEDSIRNVTDLDVARLQLGTASVGFHGEKRFTRSFRVLGDLERSLRGWAWDLRGEYRLLDQLSLEGEYLQKSFDDDVEEDVKNFRVKAVWRWLIP